MSRNTLIKFMFLLFYRTIAIYLPNGKSFLGIWFGKKIRYYCCRKIFKSCGKNVNIERGARFGNGFNIEIGNNSGIGVNCNIPADTIIGENVMMGPNVYIFGLFSHNFERIDIPMIKQGLKKRGPVKIGDDVWIGRNVTINYEIEIKKGSIVASNSVVTKSFDSYSIIGGNPAKLIRNRN